MTYSGSGRMSAARWNRAIAPSRSPAPTASRPSPASEGACAGHEREGPPVGVRGRRPGRRCRRAGCRAAHRRRPRSPRARPGVAAACLHRAQRDVELAVQLRDVRDTGQRREVGPDREHLPGGRVGLVVAPELDEGIDDDRPGRGKVRRQRDGLAAGLQRLGESVLRRAAARRSRPGRGRRRAPASGPSRRPRRPARRATDRRSRGPAGGARSRGRGARRRRPGRRRRAPRAGRSRRRSARSRRVAGSGVGSRRKAARAALGGAVVDAAGGGDGGGPLAHPAVSSMNARGMVNRRVQAFMAWIRARRRDG